MPADTEAPPGSLAQGPEPTTIERGTYELIRDRLVGHERALREKADKLNARRLEVFGGTQLAIVGNERIRTENNCVPRDIVALGDRLLFGYNVFVGLRTEIAVADVLSLHRFQATEKGFTFEPVTGAEAAFLAHPKFVAEFKELYKYYKQTHLLQLRRVGPKLLAVFQIGPSVLDIKVFRWAIDPQEQLTYLDNRGERDHVFPPSHDFEWVPTGRENQVHGRHPHMNILNEVFVETVGGDLTVKIENNTEDGLGVYREPVEDPRQSLDDGQIFYAKVGVAILLKILPYREQRWRYLVFNTRTKSVHRIDAIGQACVALPEDHGFVFPGGFYLQTGRIKTFEGEIEGMEFERVVRSPNGEDVLYVFHRRDEGRDILLPYNLIRKEVQNPIHCHGYCLYADGKMVVFRAPAEGPTRVHAMQIWISPFQSDLFAARAPTGGGFLETIGNADLVRGISDALSLCRMIAEQAPSAAVYEDLVSASTRVMDAYHWLHREEAGDWLSTLREIRATAELILAEFEKVQSLRRQAEEAVRGAETALRKLVDGLHPDDWNSVDQFVDALAGLRAQRGQAITLRDKRYVDLARLAAVDAEAAREFDRVGGSTVRFLLRAGAFEPYAQRIEAVVARVPQVKKVAEAAPLAEDLEGIGRGLELLSEVVGGLKIDDATERTRILDGISEVLARLNRGRALLQGRRKELLRQEGAAEFAAQFRLLDQSLASALDLSDTPEKCDAQLSKLLLSIEDLEGRFGEFEEFREPLARKREGVYEAVNGRKQFLVDERQRRVQHLLEAAERIFQGIGRRAKTFKSEDELNAYFASDAMVAKLREMSGKLRELGDGVRAEEVQGRLKSSTLEAARALRDRKDMFEEGAAVIKLGRHRFAVNTQPLDLTLVPRNGVMEIHLASTDFFEPVEDAEIAGMRELWDQLLVSETTEVYRGEYLAFSMLTDAEEGKGGLTLARLTEATLREGGLAAEVRAYAAARYDEGYERGVHDADAALILDKVLALYAVTDLLRFSPSARAGACLLWAFGTDDRTRALWRRKAGSLVRLRAAFGAGPELGAFAEELGGRVAKFIAERGLALDGVGESSGGVAAKAQGAGSGGEGAGENGFGSAAAGAYLFEELGRDARRFVTGAEAVALRDAFRRRLADSGADRAFAEDLRAFDTDLGEQHRVARAWLRGFVDRSADPTLVDARVAFDEAVALLLTEPALDRDVSSARGVADVEELLGQHPRVEGRRLRLRLDEFLGRVSEFRRVRVPAFRRFQARRHEVLVRERERLRLSEYQAKPMTTFVRNKLIDEVYLPLIGDNLAKQIGALGEGKRTDLMGMLLLVSPPGYGKTTLMEYVASRLGLVFMKVNGPALGHAVTSLDPAEATNATARQEVEKLNLALEMGNNVLLYLDDIQHTSSELLQKFISLCDAQRKMEGVWRGRTRTYDLRGKRFCVCMAGNPYTEAGVRFQVPDMLANRADVYNLGEILQGKDDLFALSFLENTLTSNPILAPLTTRDPADVYKLLRMARGEGLAASELSTSYSAAELGDVLAVLKRLFRIQEVALAVNREYIRSASQEDAYRTEPPFKLQGSYRNMNKMAEKVVPVMNDAELERMIDDHYASEAQTLTTGAEHNLLKLAEVRGKLSGERLSRWEEIKRGFARVQRMGGREEDPATRVAGVLSGVSEKLAEIGEAISGVGQIAAGQTVVTTGADSALVPYLKRINQILAVMCAQGAVPGAGGVGAGGAGAVAGGVNAPGGRSLAPRENRLAAQADLIDATLIPILQAMARQMKLVKGLKDRRVKAFLGHVESIHTLDELLDALDTIDGKPQGG